MPGAIGGSKPRVATPEVVGELPHFYRETLPALLLVYFREMLVLFSRTSYRYRYGVASKSVDFVTVA